MPQFLRVAVVAAALCGAALLGSHARLSASPLPQAPASVQAASPVVLIAGPPGPHTLVTSEIADLARIGLAPRAATIQVTYTGFSPEAQAAFQFAVDIWQAQISSPVPIQVTANWTPLASNVLGSAGPTYVYRDFTGAPQPNTWYAVAVANKLANTDLDPTGADINASFNSTFANWYFGTDGNTPSGKWDFVSVVLHELGHGLGFLGLMTYTAGTAQWGISGYPSIWDRNVVNGSLQSIINTALFPNPSTALGAQVTSNNLFWNGANGVAANLGTLPRLYAPSTWSSGSSYSHLDEATYPPGSANSLMTPVLNGGETIHDPGAITRGILVDSGWTIATTPGPTVTSVSPGVGAPVGGAAVIIAGTNFVAGGTTVTFGGAAATSVVVVNASQLTAVTPAGVPGGAAVAVTTPNGTGSLPNGFTYQTRVADFNGDGRSDVLWRHATAGHVWIWPMNGASPLSQNYVGTLPDLAWQVRGVGDQDGSGKADILWRNASTGAVSLWTMNGTAVTAVTPVGAVDPIYDIVGFGDYTGDGKSDILWRHTTAGDLWLWQMNGASVTATTRVGAVSPQFEVAASGDFNGDGKADIVWWHSTLGQVWVWLMNGSAPISQTYLGSVGDVNFRIEGVGDTNGDGKADVIWRHLGTGAVWVWLMNGAAVTSMAPVATVGDTNYRIVGAGDYNGDGKAEVLWRHQLSGAVWMWQMNGTSLTSQTLVATVPDTGYEVQDPR